jgi:hypothetical protein
VFPKVTIVANRLKIQGRGYLKFLPKSLGGSRLSGKIDRGFPPILDFIAFLLTSVLKFAWGSDIYPPPSPHPPPSLGASLPKLRSADNF